MNSIIKKVIKFKLLIQNLLLKKNIKLEAQSFFYIGLFLLPSAFFISGICLFVTLLISLYKKRSQIFKDKWNLPFIFLSLFLIISSLNNQFFINSKVNYWIGLLNWIPLFLCFFSFQDYLDTPKKRYFSSLSLLIGSFPLFYSCIAQYFFQAYGPYEILNGLIIWFQKPLNDPKSKDIIKGVSGLFSNANYAGLWLSMIFPFALINCINKNKVLITKILSWIIILLIAYLVVLTDSRNAFLGLLLSIPIVFSLKGILFIFAFLVLIFIIFSLSVNNILPNNLNQIFINLMSDELFIKFKLIFIENVRVFIWKETFLKILSRPVFGWGAGTFLLVLVNEITKNKITHAHNLPLEIAYNYGIPASLILTITVSFILIKSSKIIYKSKNNFDNLVDKAWLASSIIVIFSQIFDITYYDGRVSLSTWILLAGLKTIIDKNESKKIQV